MLFSLKLGSIDTKTRHLVAPGLKLVSINDKGQVEQRLIIITSENHFFSQPLRDDDDNNL